MMLSQARRGYLMALVQEVEDYGFTREEALRSSPVSSQSVFKSCIDLVSGTEVQRIDENYVLCPEGGLIRFTGEGNPVIHVL